MGKKILFVGHGRCGKDTACEFFATITGLKNAGTTSLALVPFVAAKLGLSEEEAYRRRHESDDMRLLWFHTGNEVREKDPALLVRTMFQKGDITGGTRGKPEIKAVRMEGLADLIVWIDRDVPSDPTMEYGPEWADIIIQNCGDLMNFHLNLIRLAKFAGLHNGKCW